MAGDIDPAILQALTEFHGVSHAPGGADDISADYLSNDNFLIAYNFIGAILSTLSGIVVPLGGIIMWSGSIASIPLNFHLCDGGAGTIDLRNRFVVGAGATYGVGATGGSTTQADHVDHIHNQASHVIGAYFAPGTPADYTLGSVSAGINGAPLSHGTNLPPYYALAYIQRIT